MSSTPKHQYGFPKSKRLVTRDDFSAVFDAAHQQNRQSERLIYHLDPFVVYRKKTNAASRLGIAVAKRVIRKAHDRNRIKRCLREFFRHHQSDLSGEFVVRLVQRPKNFELESLTKPLLKLITKSEQN